MWTVLTIIAAISLVIYFMRGPNVVWGGATIGLVVAVIVALLGRDFDWIIVFKGIVVGTLVGVAVELLGKLGDKLET